MKRTVWMTVAFSLLPAMALSGEVEIQITGEVQSNNSSFPSPLVSLDVGTEVEMKFRVITPGTPVDASTVEYEVIPNTFIADLDVYFAFAAFSPSWNLKVTDSAPADSLGWTATSLDDGITCSLLVNAPDFYFPSNDLEQLAGTYVTLHNGEWSLGGPNTNVQIWHEFVVIAPPYTGSTFCDPMDPNSTGHPTRMFALSSSELSSGVHLEASSGPVGQMGYFLIGTSPAEPGIAISEGRLCLSLSSQNLIGRYNVPGTSMNSMGTFDSAGIFQNAVGTSARGTGFDLPTALPFVSNPSILAGQTWHFQLWHREANGQANFSNGVAIGF